MRDDQASLALEALVAQGQVPQPSTRERDLARKAGIRLRGRGPVMSVGLPRGWRMVQIGPTTAQLQDRKGRARAAFVYENRAGRTHGDFRMLCRYTIQRDSRRRWRVVDNAERTVLYTASGTSGAHHQLACSWLKEHFPKYANVLEYWD